MIFGARDRYLNPKVARRLAALFPNSELHLLDTAGHYVQGPDHELADVAARVHEVYSNAVAGGGAWFRRIDQIEAMLPGLDLLEPGLVPIADWWPDGPRIRPLGAMQRLFIGAVARKP